MMCKDLLIFEYVYMWIKFACMQFIQCLKIVNRSICFEIKMFIMIGVVPVY